MVLGCLNKVYRITVAETVTLSPNMVADIPCEVQGVDGLDECMGVLEPADTFSEKIFCWGLPDGSDCKRGLNPSSCAQLP